MWIELTDAVATTFTWTLLFKSANAAVLLIPNPDNQHVEISLKPQGSSATYTFTESNSCGSYSTNYTFRANSACPAARMASDFSMSPNPAQDFVTITPVSNNAKGSQAGKNVL